MPHNYQSTGCRYFTVLENERLGILTWKTSLEITGLPRRVVWRSAVRTPRAGNQMSSEQSEQGTRCQAPKENQRPVGFDWGTGVRTIIMDLIGAPLRQPGYLIPRCDTFHVGVSVSVTGLMAVWLSVCIRLHVCGLSVALSRNY